MKKNPIKKVGLFATPKTMEELQKQLELLGAGGNGSTVQTAAWITWNFISQELDKLVETNKELDEMDEDVCPAEHEPDHTIEYDEDYVFYKVYEWRIYPQGSVLAGQDCKQLVESFPSLEEAKEAFPKATVGYRDPCNTYDHLPDEPDY